MPTELKPCKRCGGKASLLCGFSARVLCLHCKARVRIPINYDDGVEAAKKAVQKAVDMWNRGDYDAD